MRYPYLYFETPGLNLQQNDGWTWKSFNSINQTDLLGDGLTHRGKVSLVSYWSKKIHWIQNICCSITWKLNTVRKTSGICSKANEIIYWHIRSLDRKLLQQEYDSVTVMPSGLPPKWLYGTRTLCHMLYRHVNDIHDA